MRIAPLAVLLAGCGTPPVEDARAAVERAGVELDRLRAVIVAVCQEPPLMPRRDCDEAQAAFNALQAAYSALREVAP